MAAIEVRDGIDSSVSDASGGMDVGNGHGIIFMRGGNVLDQRAVVWMGDDDASATLTNFVGTVDGTDNTNQLFFRVFALNASDARHYTSWNILSGANTYGIAIDTGGAGGVFTTPTIRVNEAGEDLDVYFLSPTGSIAVMDAGARLLQVTGSLQVGNGAVLSKIDTYTYTPSITNTTNVSASTARVTRFIQIGTNVVVFGECEADPTATGACVINITLPIASDLTNSWDLSGTAVTATNRDPVRISANTTDNQAQFGWTATEASNRAMSFQFCYIVQ